MSNVIIGTVEIPTSIINQLYLGQLFNEVEIFLKPDGLVGKEAKKYFDSNENVEFKIVDDNNDEIISPVVIESLFYEFLYRGEAEGFVERLSITLAGEINQNQQS